MEFQIRLLKEYSLLNTFEELKVLFVSSLIHDVQQNCVRVDRGPTGIDQCQGLPIPFSTVFAD
ncbi:hypothetical protein ASE26_27530 [Duganella sp. Root198D2]|nr:hypothetical protein ASD07_18100 [Duganella sp. Root336D2]KRB93602.1 hypothetical protein ASE26_27530 [Duganella sp. Root198D2]